VSFDLGRVHSCGSEAPRPSPSDGKGTPGLPGNVISFYIVPLGPAYKAGLAVHFPARIDPTSNAKIGKHYFLKLSLPKTSKKVYGTTHISQ
jgi:hypothetical protein